MLSGSLFHGLTAAQYAVEHPGRNGLSQLHIVEEVVQGAKLLHYGPTSSPSASAKSSLSVCNTFKVIKSVLFLLMVTFSLTHDRKNTAVRFVTVLTFQTCDVYRPQVVQSGIAFLHSTDFPYVVQILIGKLASKKPAESNPVKECRASMIFAELRQMHFYSTRTPGQLSWRRI